VVVRCPRCSTELRLPQPVPEKARCTQCGAVFRVAKGQHRTARPAPGPRRPVECPEDHTGNGGPGEEPFRTASGSNFLFRFGVVAAREEVFVVKGPFSRPYLVAAVLILVVTVTGMLFALPGVPSTTGRLRLLLVFFPACGCFIYLCTMELRFNKRAARQEGWLAFEKLQGQRQDVGSILDALRGNPRACQVYPISKGFRVLDYYPNTGRLRVAVRGQTLTLVGTVPECDDEEVRAFIAHCRHATGT